MKHINFMLMAGFAILLMSCGTGKEESAPNAIPDITPFTLMVVKHPVADYPTWKTAYMAHDSLKKTYGLEHFGLGVGIDDPSMIVVYNTVSDIAKAKEFAASPELKTAMDSSGVTGAPMISFASVIRNDTSKIETSDRVMVDHRVKDFDAWLKVYDGEGLAKRAEHGIHDRGLARDVDDPNRVYIVFAISDMAKARARVGSEDLKKIMMDAGVEGAPSIFFYKFEN